MKNITIAFITECIKLRRSRIFGITIIIFIIIPLMMGLMMFVAKNPEIASKLGLIGTKAKMFGENDWKGYFKLMNQLMASLGLLGFGFVTAWVFGCEHSERTMKDILALPIGRSSIVFTKFIVIFIWCLVLTVITFSVGIFIGIAIDIPGWSQDLFSDFSKSFFVIYFLTLFLCSPVAYLAGYSKGTTAPLGFVLLTMIFAQFVGIVGLGPFFPWAIPGLYSVEKDASDIHLYFSSYIILVLTFVLGYLATLRWWLHADHH